MDSHGFFHWHNIVLAILLMAFAADIVYGLDPLLNAISTIFLVGSILSVAAILLLAFAILFWISVRDLIEDIRADKQTSIAWRWKFLALAGIFGIFIDGAVGAWNAYQKHIQFSESVEAIPFSGLPVFLLLASYPFKWAEQYFERRKGISSRRKDSTER